MSAGALYNFSFFSFSFDITAPPTGVIPHKHFLLIFGKRPGPQRSWPYEVLPVGPKPK